MRDERAVGRRAILAAGLTVWLAALALAGCTSSARPKPTGPPSSTASPTALATGGAQQSAYCASLAAAAQKINSAEVALYSGTHGATNATVASLVAELRSLQAGAPEDIQSALADMVNGFVTAQDLLAHPTAQNEAQLAAVAPKLAGDAQRISTYLISRCPAQ